MNKILMFIIYIINDTDIITNGKSYNTISHNQNKNNNNEKLVETINIHL